MRNPNSRNFKKRHYYYHHRPRKSCTIATFTRSVSDQARQLHTHTYREWANEITGKRKSE